MTHPDHPKCTKCGEPMPGRFVSLPVMALPAAASLRLPRELESLVEIAREMLSKQPTMCPACRDTPVLEGPPATEADREAQRREEAAWARGFRRGQEVMQDRAVRQLEARSHNHGAREILGYEASECAATVRSIPTDKQSSERLDPRDVALMRKTAESLRQAWADRDAATKRAEAAERDLAAIRGRLLQCPDCPHLGSR